MYTKDVISLTDISVNYNIRRGLCRKLYFPQCQRMMIISKLHEGICLDGMATWPNLSAIDEWQQTGGEPVFSVGIRCALTLKPLKYFCINHGDQGVFSI